MSPGPIQIIIVVLLILLFFGRGRISDMMGDLGKGIKSFKNAVTEDDTKTDSAPKQIEAPSPPPATPPVAPPAAEPGKVDDSANGASQ